MTYVVKGGRRGRGGMSAKAKRKTMLTGAIIFMFLFFMAPNFRRWIEETFNKWFPRLAA